MMYKVFTTGRIQMGDTVNFLGTGNLPAQEGMTVNHVYLVTSDSPDTGSHYRIEADSETGPVWKVEGRAELFVK